MHTNYGEKNKHFHIVMDVKILHLMFLISSEFGVVNFLLVSHAFRLILLLQMCIALDYR